MPSGRYRLTRTIYVLAGVRIFGFGATRPVFVLARQHARLPEGRRSHGDVHHRRRVPAERADSGFRMPVSTVGSVPPNDAIADANSGTFYPAMSNIDFEIGDGNPAAIGIRFHAAQHALPEPHGLPYRLRPGRRSPRSATTRRTSTSTAAATASSPISRRRHGSSRWSTRSSTASAKPRSASTRRD